MRFANAGAREASLFRELYGDPLLSQKYEQWLVELVRERQFLADQENWYWDPDRTGRLVLSSARTRPAWIVYKDAEQLQGRVTFESTRLLGSGAGVIINVDETGRSVAVTVTPSGSLRIFNGNIITGFHELEVTDPNRVPDPMDCCIRVYREGKNIKVMFNDVIVYEAVWKSGSTIGLVCFMSDAAFDITYPPRPKGKIPARVLIAPHPEAAPDDMMRP